MMKGGHDQPISVHGMRDTKDGSERCQRSRMEFHRAEEQQQERKEKMEEGEETDNNFPAARFAVKIPGDFRRQIAGIDDQQLPEGDISPKEHEGQQQIPEVMIMRPCNDGS